MFLLSCCFFAVHPQFAVRGFTEALIGDLRQHAPHISAHCVFPVRVACAMDTANVHLSIAYWSNRRTTALVVFFFFCQGHVGTDILVNTFKGDIVEQNLKGFRKMLERAADTPASPLTRGTCVRAVLVLPDTLCSRCLS